MTTDTQNETVQEFKKLVNMSSKELQDWLQTEESKKVGWKEQESEESVGHQSGRKIVSLLNKKNYSENDLEHMHKVIGYIKRHCAQGPTKHSTEDSKWRHSLMNWGHDPLKNKS